MKKIGLILLFCIVAVFCAADIPADVALKTYSPHSAIGYSFIFKQSTQKGLISTVLASIKKWKMTRLGLFLVSPTLTGVRGKGLDLVLSLISRKD